MMEGKLLIVMDVSGSMLEEGKIVSGKQFVRYIGESVRLGSLPFSMNLEFAYWGEDVEVMEFLPGKELSKPKKLGKCANIRKLKELFERHFSTERNIALLITDSLEFAHELSKWKDRLIVLLTGGEVLDSQIQKWSDFCFASEHFCEAVETLFESGRDWNRTSIPDWRGVLPKIEGENGKV